ncbi:MAG: AmmeMemoRadiSam system protein B [Bacillota bacterium]
MGIIMAGLSPHPPIIIPEVGKERRKKAKSTIKSLKEISEEVKERDPDLLITISPHGPVFRDAISVLDTEELSGDLAEFGQPEVFFQQKNNLEFIKNLKENSVKKNIDLITLSEARTASNYSTSTQLDHGVMVPLYFLKKAGVNVPLVPLTMGLLDYDKLFKFGEIIQNTVEEMGIKAIIIASGDLSHRLKPGAPAGYNPRGEEFDKKLMKLLGEKKFEKILNLDKNLVKKAGECGLRPIIIMLGSIAGMKVEVEVKSYEGPFGVGYGVAGFYPVSH